MCFSNPPWRKPSKSWAPRVQTEHVVHMNSSNLSHNPMRLVVIASIHRWENWGPEQLSDSAKATQLMIVEPGAEPNIVWLKSARNYLVNFLVLASSDQRITNDPKKLKKGVNERSMAEGDGLGSWGIRMEGAVWISGFQFRDLKLMTPLTKVQESRIRAVYGRFKDHISFRLPSLSFH